MKSYTTTPSNIDKIVDRILNGNLSPAKIKALSTVIQSLKGIPTSEPNDIKEQENQPMLSEEQPIDMSEITGVSIDGEKTRGVKIYKTGVS